jgi:cell division protein FtsI/penicillin-binding protein 2
MRKKRGARAETIEEKANVVLRIFLIILVLLLARAWYLAFIAHDANVELARKPTVQSTIERAERGTIRDRFNLPLAVNMPQYNAAILYSDIRQIPAITWKTDENGNRVKVYERKAYIKRLAETIGELLEISPERIEDLVYGKAALFHQVPFVIKRDIPESLYYRLRAMKRDWPGVVAERGTKRIYPRGRSGCHVVGYMGLINQNEYESILEEVRGLRHWISQVELGAVIDPPAGVTSSVDARFRLKDLEERAYTFHDSVGKTGVEGRFEEELRGFHGKKSYYADAKGNYLNELPGSRPSLPGQRILLTISAELQEYCEQILAQQERMRDGQSMKWDRATNSYIPLKEPWIKGGSIVVMDPNNGEILALASYPRFDPNDFVPKGDSEEEKTRAIAVQKWMESETHLGRIWDQQSPIDREGYKVGGKGFYDEEEYLTWEGYLNRLLPTPHILKESLAKVGTIGNGVKLLKAFESIMETVQIESGSQLISAIFSEEPHIPYGKQATAEIKTRLKRTVLEGDPRLQNEYALIKKHLEPLKLNYDKVLLLDLCHLAVDPERFSPELLELVGQTRIGSYRDFSCATVELEREVKKMTAKLFHDIDFAQWKSEEGKNYLRKMREREKDLETYQKPYIDYYDAVEKKQFASFWEKNGVRLLATMLTGKFQESDESNPINSYYEHFKNWNYELMQGAHGGESWYIKFHIAQKYLTKLPYKASVEYLYSVRSFHELTSPLYGSYRLLRNGGKQQTLKDLAAGFYPLYGSGYSRSYGFAQGATQGSIFKIVTGYAALMEKYRHLGGKNIGPSQLNPLVIEDAYYRPSGDLPAVMGSFEDGSPIPQQYKGGRLIKSLSKRNGRVDFLSAMEKSSNPYFSLLAGDCLKDPEDLNRTARMLSFGEKTGIDLPGEISGKLPDDIAESKSGLYAYGIGQHTLVNTPLQTAVMLAAIANGGRVFEPKVIKTFAGQEPSRGRTEVLFQKRYLFERSLNSLGVNFPLFSAAEHSVAKNSIHEIPLVVRREIELPDPVRDMLLQGLKRVVKRTQGIGHSALMTYYRQQPAAMADYLSLKEELVGKTSTSQAVEQIDIDYHHGVNIYDHAWFGGISFKGGGLQSAGSVGSGLAMGDAFKRPELVVVVYLRYGRVGNQAAPVAGQVVKKWREIQAAHGG